MAAPTHNGGALEELQAQIIQVFEVQYEQGASLRREIDRRDSRIEELEASVSRLWECIDHQVGLCRREHGDAEGFKRGINESLAEINEAMDEFGDELYSNHTQDRRTMVQRVESLSAIAAAASRSVQAPEQRCDTLERALDSTLDRIRRSSCEAMAAETRGRPEGYDHRCEILSGELKVLAAQGDIIVSRMTHRSLDVKTTNTGQEQPPA